MVPRHAPPLRPEPARDVSAHSKFSVLSSSHSNEADDEQSSDQSSFNMGSQASPAYIGEDTRLTSAKELAGFYIYGWAAEVFVVCGIGSFIPVTLEQLAREHGVLLSDRKTPCTADLGFNAPKNETGQCIVSFMGAEINTASFAMYTFSISVLLQSLVIISMSGAADHGRFRKTFLLGFAFVGSIATMLFLPVVSKVYLLGAFFAIIAVTCVGASFVLLNSFLPVLVRNHPNVRDGMPSGGVLYHYEDVDELAEPPILRREEHPVQQVRYETLVNGVMDETTALLPAREEIDITGHPASEKPSQELALSTKISSYGMGIGYIAALLVQTLSLFILVPLKSSTFSLRLVMFVIGAWWFLFTIPAAFWLRARPGPPLDMGRISNARACLAYFTYSWKSLGKTIMHARLLKDVLLFLAAWFLLSDSIATVSGTAVLFAKTTLKMKPEALALINVIVTICGIVGAFTWRRISVWMRLKPSQTILVCILLFEIIPLYGLLGYIPAIQRFGSFGLQQPWEMYPLGAVYGFVLGGLSSYCRSLYGELVPPGFEAAFYALYAITDKGSSVFGPAIVGAITDAYGEIRPAFWFLAVLVGLPFPLMMMVDVERGRAEGMALAEELADRWKISHEERGSDEREEAREQYTNGWEGP
ncbi:autophagy-related protein 22-2 [Delitschia confertaspora ATCC 74209]|uniref:Autophagy-related protein n=1 Tax=Delitschia confertaspora ATCC 74209 TaxID=1513339 RepID=A0A9P4JM14_9PLEO|nr:autophagy-related protein 22-2 [Delitschia confertaspora ATCC 74209]